MSIETLMLDATKADHRRKKKKKKKKKSTVDYAAMFKALSLNMEDAPKKISLGYEVDEKVDLSSEDVSDEEIEFLHSFTHAVYTRIHNGVKVEDWTKKKANTFHEKILIEMKERDIEHTGNKDLSKALTVADAGTVLVQNTTGATDNKLTYRKTDEKETATINKHSHCSAWTSEGKGRTTINADHFHLIADKHVLEAKGHTHELTGMGCGPGSFEESTDKQVSERELEEFEKLIEEDMSNLPLLEKEEQPCKTC